MPSPTPVAPAPESGLSSTRPFLAYTNFADTIHRRLPLAHSSDSDNEIFSRIITPYDADAFERLLDQHNLTSRYPLLCSNLRNGFPLGRMPILTSTIIIPNHPSCITYKHAVNKYITDELAANRISGPFSRSDVERILRGPFHCSPLIVAPASQGPGLPDKLRVCRHLSKSCHEALAVNDFIDKEDFPTHFDMAPRVEQIVSSLFRV